MQHSKGLALAGILLAGLALSTAASNSQAAPSGPDNASATVQWNGHGMLVRTALKSDQSPRLSSLKPVITTRNNVSEANENPFTRYIQEDATGPDPARQSVAGPLAMPSPIANFDGMYNQNGPIPPDPNGYVGRSHYVQTVNSMVQIFNKAGVSVYGPTNLNNLWTGFGGVCELYNSGDPIVLYDKIADRWILTQFNFVSQTSGTHQCFAVSTTGDPTGSYYRYDFLSSPTTATFEDYPHLSVWPDAYYMTTNEFTGQSGGGNFAFDRAKMLVGDPTASFVYFHTAEGGMLSSDFDGALPPAGSPNYFMTPFNGSTGQVNEYKFHVDFATPALSTFTGPLPVMVTPWNSTVCSTSRGQCVPEPNTTTNLETLAGRFMYRLAYRNMGSYESIVATHTVNATGTNPGIAGVRWYEFRNPNGATGASVFQQGTYAPSDGLYRWMPSGAMDHSGNIAIGYSTSSSTVFPSLSYAGRLVGDPVNQLAQGEATLFAGTGSEDFPNTGRWGDYSALTVDPVDDCTFWYTNEYFSVTGLRNWRTRIGSFRFPSCAPQSTATVTSTPTGPAPTASATVTATATQCAGAVTYAAQAMTTADPTQTGRLGLGSPASSCAVPKAVSGTSDSLVRHYKSYTYTNSGGSAQCVTVNLTEACGNNAVQSVAYLGSFNPASITTNYLADGGAAGPTSSYSFSLGAGQTAVVVVVEVSPNLGCANYTLTINPCAVPGTATTTTTAIATATRTSTAVSTVTNTAVVATGTPTVTGTSIIPTVTLTIGGPTVTTTLVPPTVTRTATVTATGTACPTYNFSDVNASDYFYTPVQYLACHGVINGYADGSFRPYNNTTRGQMSKIVTLGFNLAIQTPAGGHSYQDVLPGDTFYPYIETLAAGQIAGGYACGGVDPQTGNAEPCIAPDNRPYFRPGDYITRGQLVKLVVIAASQQYGWDILNPVTPSFTDVPSGSTFYEYIETAVCHQVLGGYNDNTFRPNNFAFRGQISKIVYNAVTGSVPGCTNPTVTATATP